jgi:hypothetical protein
MRAIRCPLLLFILCASTTGRAQSDSTVFDDLLFQALQGNMAPVVHALDTLQDDRLKKDQVKMKEVLLHRFRAQDEHYDYRTGDSAVVAIMRIYHHYWQNVLLDTAGRSTWDSLLIDEVCAHLLKHPSKLDIGEPGGIAERWADLLQQYLELHGYYAAAGKTGAFYDLLLHAAETEVRYPVTTPEDTLEVTVVFMDSVISNGWEGYATADTYYPGGWATDSALFCARSSYDLASEQYSVSYLKHEGKHFADYKRFPKLQSADLEYRAKLVELGSANEIEYRLIRFFQQNSAYDVTNPHAYANFCVIRDLSRSLFQKEREEDIEAWKKLPVEMIQRAATVLLLKNTRDLQAAGARTVETFIK